MFNKFLMATVVAGGMIAASSASAASISFAANNDWTDGSLTFTNGSQSISVTAVNIDASGNIITSNNPSIASFLTKGLGICSGTANLQNCSGDLGDVEGGGEDEVALLDFGPLIVELSEIHFSNVDANDDFSVLNFGSGAGVTPTAFDTNRDLSNPNGNGFEWSSDFSVGSGSLFGIGALGDWDNFKIKAISFDVVGTQDQQLGPEDTPAPVPLPAGGLLLLGGLGGLAMLRRRKKS